jgi:sortase A
MGAYRLALDQDILSHRHFHRRQARLLAMIHITEREAFSKRAERFIRWAQRFFVLSAMVALTYVAITLIQAKLFQNAASLEEQIHVGGQDTFVKTASAFKEGAVLGRIEIPRIALSVVVLQGTSAQTLRLGVGHIEGTALPGEPGNIGIAGHRDTFFRSLKNVHRDDKILLQTASGIARYEVDWIQITAPDDGGIVASTRESSLTLVTCYPFHYIGGAPERFVVHAHRQ